MGNKYVVDLWLGKFDWRYLDWSKILLGFQADKQDLITHVSMVPVVKVSAGLDDMTKIIDLEESKRLDSKELEIVESGIWAIKVNMANWPTPKLLATTKSKQTAAEVVERIRNLIRNSL